MTREEALLKLLAVEPETRDQLIQITGWGAVETCDVLDRLVAQKKVGYGEGPHVSHGRRRYRIRNAHAMPDMQALEPQGHPSCDTQGPSSGVRDWAEVGVPTASCELSAVFSRFCGGSRGAVAVGAEG